MKRTLALLPVFLAFQVCVSPALAWTWPVGGPVLRSFAFDRDNPYAGGQHRGVDIGAHVGGPVVAPVTGAVTFAGTVPGGGLTLAIRTADGYSATLVHLGSIAVARGAAVQEGVMVGTVGSTGQAELGAAHVHLGVRVAADEQGYVDPLAFLPPRGGVPPAPEPAPATGSSAPKAGGASAPAGESPASGPKHGAHAVPVAVSQAGGSQGRRADRTVRRDAALRLAREQAFVAATAGGGADARDQAVSSGRIAARERVPEAVEPAPVEATRDTGPPARAWALVLGLVTAAAVGFLGGVRRQVRDAGRAHRSTSMLEQPACATAEDAGRLRPGEHDHVLLHEDLERVLLAEAKPLANLDRDHDSPELVDAADDAGGLPLGLRRRGSQASSRSHRGGRTHLSVRSPR
jgi:hypothetical protein